MRDTRNEQERRPDEDGGAPERTEMSSGDELGGAATDPTGEEAVRPAEGVNDPSAGVEEVEVLRTELSRLQGELHEVRGQLDEMRDRFLRSRADLENYRRRAQADTERAREAGLDSAVLPILSVLDDLQRAIEAAASADPAQIVPGVRTVLNTLERNLENLGIEPVGSEGERFDPDLHEALTAVPTSEPGKADTIAQVFQLGFRKGERLIRPARVVVYQGQD